MAEPNNMHQKLPASKPVSIFFQKVFVQEKLNNWVGAFLAVVIAAIFAWLIASNLVAGVGAFALVLGICVTTICLVSAEWGLYIILFYAFAASGLSRFLFNDELPVGVVTDILVFVTVLGLFFGKTDLKQNTKSFFSTRPVVFYTIVLIYLTLEIANPLAHSFTGWLQVMRKVFESFLIMFFAYHVFDSNNKIRRFIGCLFVMATLTAIYGCFQQWHGLPAADMNWVHADEKRRDLIYIFGVYRKFSFLGGPTEFGVIMAACALLFVVLSFTEKSKLIRGCFLVGSVLMLLGMSYSGTRTANAMFVGGVAIYIMLTWRKKATKVFAFFALMIFGFLMYAPIYSNVTLIRFRSSFSGSEDASFNVREINRQRIQPYIYMHPFGGGLSTTGASGERYNPGHPLAGFPPDSSYLNKALESGWVGLILTLTLYFTILQFIIRGFFIARNAVVKNFFAASLAFFFSFFVGEIAQEAVGVFTNMAVYFPVLAIVLRLRQRADDYHKLRAVASNTAQ